MKSIRVAFASLAVAAFFASFAQARGADVRVIKSLWVPHEGKAELGPYASANGRCVSTSPGRITILQVPKKGWVSTRSWTGSPGLSSDHPAARCNARHIAGVIVEFYANDGKSGFDQFRFQVRDGDSVSIVTVNVDIQ